jgi:hypothetical protein
LLRCGKKSTTTLTVNFEKSFRERHVIVTIGRQNVLALSLVAAFSPLSFIAPCTKDEKGLQPALQEMQSRVAMDPRTH